MYTHLCDRPWLQLIPESIHQIVFLFYADNMHYQSSSNLLPKDCRVLLCTIFLIWLLGFTVQRVLHRRDLTFKRVWLRRWLHNCRLDTFVHKYVIDNVCTKGFKRIVEDLPVTKNMQISDLVVIQNTFSRHNECFEILKATKLVDNNIWNRVISKQYIHVIYNYGLYM